MCVIPAMIRRVSLNQRDRTYVALQTSESRFDIFLDKVVSRHLDCVDDINIGELEKGFRRHFQHFRLFNPLSNLEALPAFHILTRSLVLNPKNRTLKPLGNFLLVGGYRFLGSLIVDSILPSCGNKRTVYCKRFSYSYTLLSMPDFFALL